MRHLPNRELRTFPSERKKGFVGTAIIHVVALALLLILGLTVPPPPETEEGIIVNFGTDLTGSGSVEPSAPPPVVEESSPPVPRSVTPEPAEKALLTQNTEEAPEVKKVDPEAEKRRLEKIEADRRLREQQEAERKKREQEELERKRIEEEQKRQADIMNRTRDALASSQKAGTTATSEGTAGGKGNQGAPTGSADSNARGEGSGLGDKGISYNLAGRGVQSLPVPKYDSQQEGRVVVRISVDRNGRVTQATAGVQGSTNLDQYLLRVAREAALQARFEPKPDAPEIQTGTITYNFVLR